jgi:hypothetical protein
LSQPKANRLCRDGAAVSSTDSGSTTLTDKAARAATVESGPAGQVRLERAIAIEV